MTPQDPVPDFIIEFAPTTVDPACQWAVEVEIVQDELET